MQKGKSNIALWLAGTTFALGLVIALPGIFLALPLWIFSYWLVAEDEEAPNETTGRG
tara:strand:- start:417 stop:587 length:171 start_codon:yes stop_codon:yes gene_type:complete